MPTLRNKASKKQQAEAEQKARAERKLYEVGISWYRQRMKSQCISKT